MGYRSQCVVTIKKDCFDANKDKIKDIIEDCDETYFVPKYNIYVFKWDYIKWYESYPSINAMEKLLSEFDNDTTMLRIGEDPNDIEYIGDPSEYEVYLVRMTDIPNGDVVSTEELYGA
jgi:hypothetical protein